jgi:hypothetical protein
MENQALGGACQKRNNQGLIICGCQEFVSSGRRDGHDWQCDCCDHHRHMHMHLQISNGIVKFSYMSDTDCSLKIILDQWYALHTLYVLKLDASGK